MNRLIETPKTSIEINCVTYTLNTDWKNVVHIWKAYDAYNDKQISKYTYAYILLEKMYIEPPKKDGDIDIWNEKALRFVTDYLNAFSDKDGERRTKVPRIDIEQDSGMIFNAFLAMNINLRTYKMDYEEFQARLSNIPSECEYATVTRMRTLWYDNRKKMTKEDKELCKRIGWHKIKIDKKNTDNERSDEYNKFMEAFKS